MTATSDRGTAEYALERAESLLDFRLANEATVLDIRAAAVWVDIARLRYEMDIRAYREDPPKAPVGFREVSQ